jgi:hypothetical protein
MRAQIPGSDVPQAPMGREPKAAAELVEPVPVEPPREGLTDAFLQSVAENYTWARATRQRPAPFIASQTNSSVRTVHSWIAKARDRGMLKPTTKGRAG